MTAGTTAPGRAQISARTLRTDRWWVQPAVTVVVLVAFIIYATIRAFANDYYYSAPYISPFYSPCLATSCVPGSGEVAIFGDWWKLSPALIILIFPLGFRLTCYYYRKAYYRAFWLSPPACAVSEPHGKYTGERRFPLILQNSHRFWWYIAMLFQIMLGYDVVKAFDFGGGIGMSLGTLVLLVNWLLILGYTLS